MTLREARKKKGYTSKYVAEKLGIKERTLNKKERENKFTLHQLMELCNLYNVSLSDLSN